MMVCRSGVCAFSVEADTIERLKKRHIWVSETICVLSDEGTDLIRYDIIASLWEIEGDL